MTILYVNLLSRKHRSYRHVLAANANFSDLLALPSRGSPFEKFQLKWKSHRQRSPSSDLIAACNRVSSVALAGRLSWSTTPLASSAKDGRHRIITWYVVYRATSQRVSLQTRPRQSGQESSSLVRHNYFEMYSTFFDLLTPCSRSRARIRYVQEGYSRLYGYGYRCSAVDVHPKQRLVCFY